MRFYHILFLLSFLSCGKEEIQVELSDFSKLNHLANLDLELSGKSLSDAYCSVCHIKPDPSLLDKQTWEKGVLPNMRHRLGLINEEDFGLAVGEDNNAPDGIYSKKRLITQKQWDAIQEYYLSNAPDTLQLFKENMTLADGNDNFTLIKPDFSNLRPNLSTIVRFDENNNKLYVADRLNHIFSFDPITLELLDSIQIASPAFEMLVAEGSVEVLTMGYMDPSNSSFGKLLNL